MEELRYGDGDIAGVDLNRLLRSAVWAWQRWQAAGDRVLIRCQAGPEPLRARHGVIAGSNVENRLVVVGRTGQLIDAQAGTVAPLLTPARFDRPFPDPVTPNVSGAPDSRVRLVKVEPTVVVKVSADAATHAGGRFRHTLRYVRGLPATSGSGTRRWGR